MKHSLYALCAGAALLAATPSPQASPSASASPSSGLCGNPDFAVEQTPSERFGVWTIYMTEIDGNQRTGDFSTPCKVYVTRNGGDITGDRASGNFLKGVFTVYGDVVIHDTEGNFAGLSSAPVSKSHTPATLTADQVHIDDRTTTYTASGHVHYVHGETVSDADSGTLIDAKHQLDLQGNVHISQGNRTIQAAHVLYNTVTDEAHAEGDPVTLMFPSQIAPHFATPRPIKLKVPIVEKPAASPAPSSTP